MTGTGLANFVIGSFAGLSVLFTILTVQQLSKSVPEEHREFMDLPPRLLQFIWPIVRIIAYFGCALLPYSYLHKQERRLRRNGVAYIMMAEEFIALRIFSALVFFTVGFILLHLVGEWTPFLYPILPLIGFFYPDIWVRDIRKRQVDAVLRTLPAYLDFITMAVEAGLNFSGALEQARKKGPASPLANEFGIVLRDLRSGIPRTKALRRMAKRLDIHEVTSFVNAIVQAENLGSSMASIFRIQADQRRTERFQRAEKKAMEAPVKLMGPLVIFIFPTTFMVLAFPIAMKILQEGLF